MQLVAEVLGPIRLLVDGTPIDLGGPRRRRLLGALLAHQGRIVSTDRLVHAVFQGDGSEAAPRTFRTYVARLRRALATAGVDATSVIVTAPPGYVLGAAAVTGDWTEFEEGVRHGQDRLAVDDPDGAMRQLEAALARWHGAAYGEFAAEEWAQPEAIRLEELKLAARELHIEAMIASGRHTMAAAQVEGLINEQPLREGPRRLLMLALFRAGRHAEALRAGRKFRQVLAEETGLEATDQLDRLERQIIDRDPRLDRPARRRRLRGYLLGEPLGENPLGWTYLGTQPSVGRDVAVTVSAPERADDPLVLRRFELHAQRVAAIEHTNVVPLYDYWREPGGAYLVTRYLSGGSLQDRLARVGLLRVDEIQRVLRELGAGLAAAHRRGVAHGPLTPTRVLFDGSGCAHLTEFGLGAERLSVSTDLQALAGIAGWMWRNSATGPTGGPTSTIGAEVETVLVRARQREHWRGHQSIGEFVEQFCSALPRESEGADAPRCARRHPFGAERSGRYGPPRTSVRSAGFRR